MELRKQIVDYMISKGVLFISFNNNVDRALWIGSSQHSQAYIMPKSFTEWGDIVYSCVIVEVSFECSWLIQELRILFSHMN